MYNIWSRQGCPFQVLRGQPSTWSEILEAICYLIPGWSARNYGNKPSRISDVCVAGSSCDPIFIVTEIPHVGAEPLQSGLHVSREVMTTVNYHPSLVRR